MDQGIVILMITLFILFLIGLYWYCTTYRIEKIDQVDTSNENTGSKTPSKEGKEIVKEEIKCENQRPISVITNLYQGKINQRIINLLTYNGEYFIYLPKNSSLIKELEISNEASVSNYITRNDIQIQILLSGILELQKEFETINIYKFIVSDKRVSNIVRTKDNEIINFIENGVELDKQVTSHRLIKDVTLFLQKSRDVSKPN